MKNGDETEEQLVNDHEQGRISDSQRAQERVLALSRTAAKVQSVLELDRIFETIGDELGSLGLNCLFGLVDDEREKIVLRHINLRPKVLEAAQALTGLPAERFSFPVDASPHIEAVVREGKTLFEEQAFKAMGEVLPDPLKGLVSRLAGLIQLRQAISAPLVVGQEVLGVLTVWSNDLTGEDIPAVSVFAQQAAAAIENANLYQEEMQRVFEMEALRQTTLEITTQLDVPQLLHSIMERAAALVGTKGGGLYPYHPEEEELELVVSHNLGEDYTGARLKVGEGLSGKVVQTGEPLIVEDYASWEDRARHYDKAPFRGVIGMPLKWGKKIVRVVNVTDAERARSSPMLTPNNMPLSQCFFISSTLLAAILRGLSNCVHYSTLQEGAVPAPVERLQIQWWYSFIEKRARRNSLSLPRKIGL